MSEMNLEQLKKKDIFKVPENYFEHLPNEVMAKVNYRRIKQKRNRVLLSIASAAASIAIVIGIINFYGEGNELTQIPQSSQHHDIAQIIAEKEFDNLDYQIMEYYEDQILLSETYTDYE